MSYYRCRFPDEYALANKLAHPSNIYLREDQLVRPLDDWLLTALAPNNLEATIDAMLTSQTDDATLPQAERLREVLDECDRKIANYRALLDAGTDPNLVASWIAETSAQRAAAKLANARTTRRPDGPGSAETRSVS